MYWKGGQFLKGISAIVAITRIKLQLSYLDCFSLLSTLETYLNTPISVKLSYTSNAFLEMQLSLSRAAAYLATIPRSGTSSALSGNVNA